MTMYFTVTKHNSQKDAVLQTRQHKMTVSCRYILLETTLEHRTCYGIAAVTDQDDCTVILEQYTDLSSDRNAVDKFVQTCNMLGLERCHLQDAVEDFLVK